MKDHNKIGQAIRAGVDHGGVGRARRAGTSDVDTDFANQLHGYGIYAQRDYNAWLGRITCERLGNGIDADAYKSAAFLSKNLPRGSTTAQAWQFLAIAIGTYCPDQMPVLTSAAGRR
ncbi:MAG: hypothetical protein JWR48_644 [Mycobacterium sp.]|jgi:hypothetical protein|nr:hypothetical protein [Mycobacterium sp.]